jgi:hypothetical protein
MTLTQYPRPCPIPGHPQDEQPEPLAAESAWSRLKAWHLHAPAERLPLPLVLTVWSAAWVTHQAHVPGHDVAIMTGVIVVCTWLAWARHYRKDPGARFLPTEAALVTAAAGGWVTAAVTWGPAGWPAHLLSWIYVAGAAGGYAWLRQHPAIRAARERRDDDARWIARKAWWHSIAHDAGLGAFHLQDETRTHLGYDLLLTGGLDAGEQALRVVAGPRSYAVRLLQLLGLPYGRCDFTLTRLPGQLVVSVREQDPSENGPVLHPAIDPASPYAGWFPARRSIRQPVPIGVIPETGEPMELVLWDEEGGKAIGIYSMTGGGKTNILDVIREAVTAMDDAVLVSLNGAGSGDERAWGPLSLLTAAGLQEDDPGVREKILGALRWVRHLIGERAETAAQTGDSVFQPTPGNPAVVVIADEIDETAKPEGASKILEFLASKQRKAAVILILAGQRATATWTGGAGVRINLSTVVTGMLARDSESRHAVGAENEIPDIAGYSGGEAGFFQIWSVRAKKILARGRGFYIGRIGDQQREIISKRDPAARPVLEGAGIAPEAAPREQPGSALRERLAKVQALNEDRPLPAGATPGGSPPAVPGVPQRHAERIVRLLATKPLSARAAAGTLEIPRSTMHRYLTALREAGWVAMTGEGQDAQWHLVRQEPERYVTIQALAELVLSGVVQADDEQRALLAKAWAIEHGEQPAPRPRLTLIQGGECDTA